MKCFHLPITKGNEAHTVHLNADLVESLIPDNPGTIVGMASGETFETSADIESVLTRIANAHSVHKKNGD